VDTGRSNATAILGAVGLLIRKRAHVKLAEVSRRAWRLDFGCGLEAVLQISRHRSLKPYDFTLQREDDRRTTICGEAALCCCVSVSIDMLNGDRRFMMGKTQVLAVSSIAEAPSGNFL
jgi:hypothetical protein